MGLRKEEYILKYGEEAYEKYLKYHKEYQEKNRYKLREKAREYREKNRYKLREKAREYREKNRYKLREKAIEYYENNKDKRIEYQRRYKRTVVGRFTNLASSYNCIDKKRGLNISNNVTGAWIARYIIGNRCIYCGDDNVSHLGLDRIDNAKPHTEDNVVCSCFLCNSTRGNRYTVDEFIEIMKDKRKT